jgi:hypothetical protein
MNERIKKLAEQCWDSRIDGQLHFDQEMFAELIIKECTCQIALIGISNFENDDHGDISWTVSKCIEMIESRFGVE